MSERQRDLLRFVFILGIARETLETWTEWETLEGPKHFASPAQARTWLDAHIRALVDDKSDDAQNDLSGRT